MHLLSPPAVPFSTPQQKGRVLILEITGMRHSIVEWLLGETVKKRNRSTHDLLYMFSPPTRSLDQVAGRLPRESFVPYSHHDHQLQTTTTTTEVTAMKSISVVIGMGLQLNSIDSLLHFIHFKGRIELRLIRQCFCCCCCCRY